MSRSAVLIVSGITALFAGIGFVNLNRYTGTNPAIEIAKQRLESVPLTIGPWHGREVPLDPAQLRIAEAEASLSRNYSRGDTKESVGVLVLYGRPGPLGAHTPEVCYGSAGYEPISEPKRVKWNDRFGEVWSGRFEKAGFPPQRLQVTWAWGTGDSWQALTNPRVQMAAEDRVYKLYTSRVLPPGTANEPTKDDEFLTVFLPVLRASLTGSPATQPGPATSQAPESKESR